MSLWYSLTTHGLRHKCLGPYGKVLRRYRADSLNHASKSSKYILYKTVVKELLHNFNLATYSVTHHFY